MVLLTVLHPFHVILDLSGTLVAPESDTIFSVYFIERNIFGKRCTKVITSWSRDNLFWSKVISGSTFDYGARGPGFDSHPGRQFLEPLIGPSF